MNDTKEWFVSWFDTPYYHILYKHRDYKEAQVFMKNLVSFLKFNKNDCLLDLACGKGRHSTYLNKLGFNVEGADLSKNSIAYAKQYENERLHFYEHDMRNPFDKKYQAILNLFTSFGFFEDDQEDISILKNIKQALEINGVAVIDFMNSKKVVENLVSNETKTIDGIEFQIQRSLKNSFIVKDIRFEADGNSHQFSEKVKCLDLEKINFYLNEVGFKIKHIFGNYHLEEFDEQTSDRLILVLE